MAAGAVITLIFIVYSSFVFKKQQSDRFEKNARMSTDLLTKAHPYISNTDSLTLGELEGKDVIVLFWATWSEKSALMMDQLELILSSEPDVTVVGALVKDATDTAEPVLSDHPFLYIDGTVLFNDLKVPGIPSLLILDTKGKVITTHIGYQEDIRESILDILRK